jgi:hypothetical protein
MEGSLIILYLTWILYSVFEGFREACYWHHRTHSEHYKFIRKNNIHPVFSLQRTLVLLFVFASANNFTTIIGSIIFVFLLLLSFSFFHNGMLYLVRNQLYRIIYPNSPKKWIYNKRWFEQSTTSTAKTTYIFNPLNRTIMFIVSLIGLICLIIFS